MDFLNLVGTFLLFSAGIAAFVGIGYIFPNKMKENMAKYYGDPIVSTWWAIVQAVVFVALTCEWGNTKEASFWILLVVTLAVFAAAIGSCVWKLKKVGAEKQDVVLSCLAQVFHAFGIAITILFVLALLFGRSKKKKEDNRKRSGL